MWLRFDMVFLLLLLLGAVWYGALQYAPVQGEFWLKATGSVWMTEHPASFAALKDSVLNTWAEWLWDPFLAEVLSLPLAFVCGLVVILLVALFWRKPAALAKGDSVFNLENTSGKTRQVRGSELSGILRSCRNAFWAVAMFSGMINILMLTGAFYMLQVYDRVLPSRSVTTLVALSIIAAGLFLFQGLLDLIRGRILLRIGASLDASLSGRVFDVIMRLPLIAPTRGEGLQPMRDLDAIRGFLSGAGPTALFDLPWMPVYLAIVYAFHPMLGIAGLMGAIILIILTILTEYLTRKPLAEATGFAMQRNGFAESSRRNAEVISAMGMSEGIRARWAGSNRDFIESNRRINDVAGGFGSMSKALRMLLQSAVLGIGAYFVIQGQATAGIIIAGSILVARALAPVDLAIANWRGFIAARQSYARLGKLLQALPTDKERMQLPPPSQSLKVDSASAVPPSGQTVVVQDMNFELKPGNGLGVIGPSGSGKSCLVRMLVGVWKPVRGSVQLDGAALDQWTADARARHVGYLPQDVELFSGTVAENISRFAPDAASDSIISAAQAAGVHDIIVKLPNGYETELGEGGQSISAGQRQRIGLARALYGDPFLVVLDEPNSNLDADGERALTQAILSVRKRSGIIIVVAHRPSVLAGVDMLLVMNQGKIAAFGPRDQVVTKNFRSDGAATPAPLKAAPKNREMSE